MSLWNFALGLAAAVAIGTIAVAVLSYESIVGWFREQLAGTTKANLLAVTVTQHLESGNYRICQGLFNPATAKYESQRNVEAEEIDTDFLAAHNKDGIAIWNT